MTTPTPPTPLERAREIVADFGPTPARRANGPSLWRADVMSGKQDAGREIQLVQAALTDPQHRAEIRREAFAEAAKVADKMQEAAWPRLQADHDDDAAAQADTAMEIAAAIRALGETP